MFLNLYLSVLSKSGIFDPNLEGQNFLSLLICSVNFQVFARFWDKMIVYFKKFGNNFLEKFYSKKKYIPFER